MPLTNPQHDYLLLTPGPLTTSPGVRAAMNHDLSTWDTDYNRQIQSIRHRLAVMASSAPGYTSVLVQGCGTGAVEATIGHVFPQGFRRLLSAIAGVINQNVSSAAPSTAPPTAPPTAPSNAASTTLDPLP